MGNFVTTSRASRTAMTALLAGGLLATTAHVAAAAPAPRVAEAASVVATSFTAQQAQLAAALELIEQMPESVIRGGHASMAAWVGARVGPARAAASTASIAGCVAAVGLAVLAPSSRRSSRSTTRPVGRGSARATR